MQKIGAVQKLREQWDNVQYHADIKAFESFSLELDATLTLYITGCREIKAYEQAYILLDCNKTAVKIIGSDLFIKEYSPLRTVVNGKIEGITLL